MLVPDEIRKCVCFLHYTSASDGEVRPAGTAFLLAEPSTVIPEAYWTCLVTARHVINQVRAKSTDGMVQARFNAPGGGVEWMVTHVDGWKTNPDESIVDDVAVAGFTVNRAAYDFKTLPVEMLASDAIIVSQSIGLGDEVFMTGLFVNHYGRERNVPIVRIGNIAAMPEEPVQTALGPMDAYLIEARSIGGLSGSPVFVNVGWDRSEEAQGSILLAGSGRSSHFFLLGVLHGHWDVEVADTDATVGDEARVNLGIAIVIPSSRILDILHDPEVVAGRQQSEQEWLRHEGVTSGEPPE